MSKLPLDLSKFRKVKSDEKSSTLQHKDGHTLIIAHSKLSPKLRTDLDKIPMHGMKNFSDGGKTGEEIPFENLLPADESDKTINFEKIDTSKPENQYYGVGPDPLSLANQSQEAATQNNPEFQGSEPSATPATPEDPLGYLAASQGQLKGLGEQKAGQQQVEKAKGALGEAEAKHEQEYQNNSQQINSDFQSAHNDLTADRQQLQSDIANFKVDPNKYINDMKTGDKIMSGIGLVLGGMGAGLTHGPNLAFQYLSNQIDRDIESQKSELGKKENLLSKNFQATGDLRASTDLLRLHNNDMLSSQLKMEAAKAATPIAQGNIMNIAGMIDNQSAQIQQQLAMRRAMMGIAGGQSQGVSMEMLPKDMRDRAVKLPGGGMALAITTKGAETVREQLQSIEPIFNSLDQLQQLGPSALIPGSPSYQKAKAIQAQLIPLVNENAGLRRLSAEDIMNIRHMLTDPTQFSSIVSGSKTQSFKKFLQDKLLSTMSNQLEGNFGRPQQQKESSMEGQIASNAKGDKIIMKNGKWVPYNG